MSETFFITTRVRQEENEGSLPEKSYSCPRDAPVPGTPRSSKPQPPTRGLLPAVAQLAAHQPANPGASWWCSAGSLSRAGRGEGQSAPRQHQVMGKISTGKPGAWEHCVKADLQQIPSVLSPSSLAFTLRLWSKDMACISNGVAKTADL